MITFSETPVTYPDGQQNMADVPESIMQNGFIPKQLETRGMPIVAQYLNRLFRDIFREINKDRVDDGNGLELINADDEGVIVLHAVVKADVNKYIHAMGYKVAGATPSFKVLTSNTLTISTLSPSSIVISGAAAADVAVRVSIRK